MQYGLIGEKLGHSFSQIIHSKLADYDYCLREIAPTELDRFMKERQFKAINVTIPYKQSVIPYLDKIDSAAAQIGAVNTVVNRDGRLLGYNTDFVGMKRLIERSGAILSGADVLILGSGGTSRTAAAVCKALGANAVRVSRSARDGCISYEMAYATDAKVIINTTPCGMYPNLDGCPIDIDRFENLTAVFDAVYNPLRTRLICRARKRGLIAEGGLYMLVAQAAEAVRHFTGREVDWDEVLQVYRELLAQKQSIVLIGMPGCGKSTVGRALAEQMGRRFIDSDEQIVNRQQRTVSDIFACEGEAYFRDIEADVIADISSEGGSIIATGGGAVLRAESVLRLSQNGRLYFIDRPLCELVGTPDRPTASNAEALANRYRERYSVYCASADCIVTSVTPQQNIKRILEDFTK